MCNTATSSGESSVMAMEMDVVVVIVANLDLHLVLWKGHTVRDIQSNHTSNFSVS